ncbi:MAG: porin family protein [Ginsengibacter sp.]
MKIKFLFAAIICFFATNAFSQGGFSVGIKAGADIHKLEGKAFKDEFSYGYHLGGFMQIGLTKKFGIQPEVLFSQVSADTSSSFSSVYKVGSLSNIKLKYLKIPLLINFSPNPFVSLQLGPEFGVLLDDKSNILDNGKNAFSKGDLSMLGGLQLNISKIRIYGRYAVGLKNINDIDNQDKWKNQNVELGIGLAL